MTRLIGAALALALAAGPARAEEEGANAVLDRVSV